jgi:hypothetical protein
VATPLDGHVTLMFHPRFRCSQLNCDFAAFLLACLPESSLPLLGTLRGMSARFTSTGTLNEVIERDGLLCGAQGVGGAKFLLLHLPLITSSKH